MNAAIAIIRTSSTSDSFASVPLRVAANDYHPKARVLLNTATTAIGEADSIVQAYIRAYHTLVPKRTIEEEEAEERQWHAIISQPHVEKALLRLAEEVRRQIAAGETEVSSSVTQRGLQIISNAGSSEPVGRSIHEASQKQRVIRW